MLVEGGYLHSMKQLIEKASETPDVGSKKTSRAVTPSRTKESGTVLTSLKRLGVILLGWDFQR
jgi:hypothetical protein